MVADAAGVDDAASVAGYLLVILGSDQIQHVDTEHFLGRSVAMHVRRLLVGHAEPTVKAGQHDAVRRRLDQTAIQLLALPQGGLGFATLPLGSLEFPHAGTQPVQFRPDMSIMFVW